MTNEEFLIKIGLQPDKAQNELAIEEVLKKVEQALEKEFKFKIDTNSTVSEIDQVIEAINKFKAEITTIVNDSGKLVGVSTSFQNVDKEVVKLNTSVRTTSQSLQSFLKDAGGMGGQQLQGLVNAGQLVDDLGKKVENLNDIQKIIMNSGNYSVLKVDTDTTTFKTDSVNKYNDTIKELNENLNRQIELKKIINSANDSRVYDYSKELSDLEEISQKLKEQITDKNKLAEIEKKYENKQSDLNEGVYQKILTLLNQIEAAKIKMNSADSVTKLSLEAQVTSYQNQISRLQTINNLTDTQKKSIEAISNAIGSNSRQAQIDAERAKDLKDYNAALQQRLKIEQELRKINPDSNYANLLRQEANELNKVIGALQDKHQNTKILDDATKSYLKTVEELNAKEADKTQDNAKIEEAIKLTNQLADAQIELEKAKHARDSSETIELYNQKVQDLSNQLENAKQAVLSNNTAVEDNARVNREAAEATARVDSATQQLNSHNEQSTSLFSQLTGKVKDLASNFIQLNVAMKAANFAEDFVRDSVDKVKELDDAMTEIRLVTGQTGEQARQTMNDYAGLAQQLGATTQEVAQG